MPFFYVIMKDKYQIDYRSSFKFLYPYILKYKKQFIISFLLFVLTTLIRLLGPFIVKQIIDVGIKNKDIKYFYEIILLYLIVNIMFFAFNYSAIISLIKSSQSLIADIKKNLYEKLLKFDIDYFSNNNPGKIAARIQNDTDSIFRLFSESSLTVFVDIFVFVSIFIIMAYNNLKLTLILLPVVLFMFFLAYLYVTKTQKLFIEVRKKISDMSSFLSEALNFFSLIRIFKLNDFFEKKLDDVNYDKFKKIFYAEAISSVFFLTILLLDPVSKAIIFGYGGIKVLNNEMSVGSLVMFILYIGQLFEPLFRFSSYFSVIQKSFSAIHRIKELFYRKESSLGGEMYINNFTEGIKFKNVWMKYDSSDWILKNISLDIPVNRTVAIVGRTGSGKTTLVNVLLKFYDYQKGSIKIDSIELKDIALNSLRSKIGMVWQDVYLFPGTVRDNLKLLDESIPDDKLSYAVRVLNLDEFYRKLKFDSYIKEKGANLSMGEKQIISLTRAMVLDQSIIVMDEATSNIDPHTERLIKNAVAKLMKHKTMIVIAHRLSTIRNADIIVFLHDGKIVESGNHDELMKLGGYYYNFYRLQE